VDGWRDIAQAFEGFKPCANGLQDYPFEDLFATPWFIMSQEANIDAVLCKDLGKGRRFQQPISDISGAAAAASYTQTVDIHFIFVPT
jgi:hypothetical protein